MSTPVDPIQPAAEGGFLAPKPGSAPGDHCYRCGKPTAAGMALCPACNPGKIKGPSSTQLHATILGGVALGVVGLLIAWRLFFVGQGGPYSATIVERTMGVDGGPSVTITVENVGERAGTANCRVTRDGAPRPDDPAYRTERIEPGTWVTISRTIAPPPITTPAYELERMSVLCT